jgi:hypothetical protein
MREHLAAICTAGNKRGGGDHQHVAGLGRDLGERLVQQYGQVAVGHPAGLELLTVGVGAKPPHKRAPRFSLIFA